jgi:hypothetical protein
VDSLRVNNLLGEQAVEEDRHGSDLSFPNILGGVFTGIPIALVIGAAGEKFHRSIGLGLPGAISINLCGETVLAMWLIFSRMKVPAGIQYSCGARCDAPHREPSGTGLLGTGEANPCFAGRAGYRGSCVTRVNILALLRNLKVAATPKPLNCLGFQSLTLLTILWSFLHGLGVVLGGLYKSATFDIGMIEVVWVRNDS